MLWPHPAGRQGAESSPQLFKGLFLHHEIPWRGLKYQSTSPALPEQGLMSGSWQIFAQMHFTWKKLPEILLFQKGKELRKETKFGGFFFSPLPK